MREKTFREHLRRQLESTGGLTLRINDVPRTGIRYSDLIWIWYGHVIGIECKVLPTHDSSVAPYIRQGRFTTPAQPLANHLFQRVGAIYVYCFLFADKKVKVLFYRSGEEYDPHVEYELLPTYVLDWEDFMQFARAVSLNKPVLEQFIGWCKQNEDV